MPRAYKKGPPELGERHRERLRQSNILTRLIMHVEGTLKDHRGQPIEMSPSQVTAAIALLKKFLPDLQAVSIETVDPSQTGPVKRALEVLFVDAEVVDAKALPSPDA